MSNERRTGSALTVDPGAFPVPLKLYPPGSTEAMLPERAAFFVTHAANPDALARVRLTAFVIDGHAQDVVDERQPTAETTAVLWSDLFMPDGGYVTQVHWGVFSQRKPLEIYGYNPNAYTVEINACVWGREVGVPPLHLPWWRRALSWLRRLGRNEKDP